MIMKQSCIITNICKNVSAAKTEGEEVRGAYKKLGFINTSNEIPFNFLIPVYENMPKQNCPYPGSQTIVTQNVELNSKADIKKKKQKVQQQI